jgi:hypothetical protein
MWNLTPTTEAELLTTTTGPAYVGRVFLTEGRVPPKYWAKRIAKLDAGAVQQDPTDKVLIMLADRAREVGANAVFDLKIWRAGSGFSWLAPQGSGTAVFISNTNAFSGMNGYWR